MLPRLWLLVGSKGPRDRQCNFLSCPGQLKKGKIDFLVLLKGAPVTKKHLSPYTRALSLVIFLISDLPMTPFVVYNFWFSDNTLCSFRLHCLVVFPLQPGLVVQICLSSFVLQSIFYGKESKAWKGRRKAKFSSKLHTTYVDHNQPYHVNLIGVRFIWKYWYWVRW